MMADSSPNRTEENGNSNDKEYIVFDSAHQHKNKNMTNSHQEEINRIKNKHILLQWNSKYGKISMNKEKNLVGGKENSVEIKERKLYNPSHAALKNLSVRSKGEIIDKVIGIVDIAFGVKDILQEFGIFPDKEAEEFEKVLSAIGKNYAAIEEVGHKVDRNFVAMKVIFEVVSKTLSSIEETRIEMRQGFRYVLESINELKVGDKISNLAIFMDDFFKDINVINKLSLSARVSELERSGGILDKIKSSIASGGILHGNLYHIINEQLAIPINSEDDVAFTTFHVLYYGVQTYVSEMFFVLDQYSFLADYYYKTGDIEKCNQNMDYLEISFIDFRASLLSGGDKKRLIEEVRNVIMMVERLPFVQNKRRDILEVLPARIYSLNTITQKLEEMIIPIILDQPGIIMHKPDFSKSKVKTPIGHWQKGATVSYAIQYKNNNTYSKIGRWSESLTIDNIANPIIKIPVDPQRRTRLIFRKFNHNKPELIGDIRDKNQITFRDINRDLYDVAMSSNEDKGKKEMEVLIHNGANITEVFDDGRQAIHAAAQGGNCKTAFEILKNNIFSDIDVRDANGYTPIYIAAEAGYQDFVNFSIFHGADVNIQTNFDKYTPLHIATYKGDIPTIKILLQSNHININSRDKRGFTPLHNAIFGGTFAINTLLLCNSTDVNAKSLEGLTPLHIASINDFDDATEALIKSDKLDLNSVANGNLTALHFASSLGNTNVIRYLVSKNETDVNLKSTDWWTALHYSTFLKKEDTVLVLLEVPRIDVNVKGKNNITPLHVATVTEQKNVVLNLLTKGAMIEEKTRDGFTALHLTAMLNKCKIISILIENGANIEARTLEGSTPLSLAAFFGSVKIVFILLDKGANSRTFNNNGQFPIHEAILNGKDKVVLLLIVHDPTLVNLQNQHSEYPLHLAAQENYTFILDLLATRMSNLNIRNNSGETPLYYAVKNNRLDAIEYLAKKGADLNSKDNLDEAPLHWAAKNNKPDVIKCLATNGADLNIKDRSGWTPLHWAAKDSHLEAIKILAEKGANLNISDNLKWAPLHWATKNNHPNAIKCLAEMGADLNIKDKDGWAPLHWAIKNGFFEATKALAYSLADINVKDNYLDTPLHFAVQIKRFDLVKYLIEKGAIVNVIDKVGWFGGTPLNYAAIQGSLEIVKYLISKGADINGRDISGTTTLHCAVGSRNFDIVKILLENNANVDPAGMDGRTPLFDAAVNCDLDIVKLLAKYGANCNARDNSGRTPSEFIFREIYPRISDRTCYHNMLEYLRFCYRNVSKSGLSNLFSFGRYFYQRTIASTDVNRSKDIVVISDDDFKADKNSNAHTNPFNDGMCMGNNIALAFFLFQSFLNTKYPFPKIYPTAPETILASTLKITEQFENLVVKTAEQSGILLDETDFFEVYKVIGHHIRNEKYSQIPSILYSYAKKAFYANDDFLKVLKSNIKKMLDDQQILNTV